MALAHFSPLLSKKQLSAPGNHKMRGVRLLRSSPAADLTADLFTAAADSLAEEMN